MRKSLLMTPLAAATFVLAASMPASAGSVFFNFDSLAQQAAGTTAAIATANKTAIQNYMNNELFLQSAPGSVAVGPGAIADRSYNGEGFVVGAGLSGTPAVTLGTSDSSGGLYPTTARAGVACTTAGCTGATDTFIRNDSFGSPVQNSWSFTFAGWATITSVTFDYEIFPEAGGAPDMTFSTNLGVVAGWPKFGLTPGSGGASSPNMHSLNDGTGVETNKQLIGTGTFATPGVGVNKLIFTDWPATVGIDNLTVNYTLTPPPGVVPEPGSMILLASGLAALYARRKKRAA